MLENPFIVASIIIFYIIPTISLLIGYIKFLYDNGEDLELGSKIFVFLVVITPLVGVSFAIVPFFEKKIKKIKNKEKTKLILKERERKIKLGIIRISEADPFGEETWENLK